jgi:nitrite reductase/ring-hydroxylating ferredoxin subunit
LRQELCDKRTYVRYSILLLRATPPVLSLALDREVAMNPATVAPIGGPAPAYPEGWFQVGYSDDLARGQMTRLRYFGRDLVLFRTQGGVAQVLNAHCPHVGANLAVGGTVVGEYIQCPFHNWRYDVGGRCREIPYSAHIPDGAVVGAWPTEERSGLIFMWHSPMGNEPQWEPPVFSEYGDPAWKGYIRKHWILRTTIQEVCENAVDGGHLPAVHSPGVDIPPIDYEFGRHTFNFNFRFGEVAGNAERGQHFGTYYGLGLSVSRSFGAARHTFLTARTPIDETTLEVRFSMLTAAGAPYDPQLARKGADYTAAEFEKDIPIWENKVYLPAPLLCKGDGPIGRFRMWARQFFPADDAAQEPTAKVA